MIIRAPAVIKKGATVIYTEENIIVKTEIATVEGKNSIHGKYDEFDDNVMHTITFKPAAQATAAYFDLLFPAAYRNPVMGASIYGDNPDDIIIWTKSGEQHTYKAGALTGMPDLGFGAVLSIFDGEATFIALGAAADGWDTEGHFAAFANVVFNDVSFNRANDIRTPYTVSWGAAPFDSIVTEAGVKVKHDLQLADEVTDAKGIIGKYITGLVVTASFTPQGITAEQMLTAMGIQGAGARRGRSRSSLARDLIITTGVEGEPYYKLFNCMLKASTPQFGVGVNNQGEVSLQSVLKITDGASTPVFEIGLTPAA